MGLRDRPPYVIRWDTGLSPELLQALGNLAVVSAEAEQLLHLIYWKHAGLNEDSGPIMTDNLNPKRLGEDILKLVALDVSKENILSDLKIVLAEFVALNTKRNHCLHWIWTAEMEGAGSVTISQQPPQKTPPYKVLRPIYRQTGIESEEFHAADIQELCADFSWLVRRLVSHTLSDDEIRNKRNEVDQYGAMSERSFGHLFWPAPWLDKPIEPNPKPSDLPDSQK